MRWEDIHSCAPRTARGFDGVVEDLVARILTILYVHTAEVNGG